VAVEKDQSELTGYSDRLSVAPGETIRFHVSTDAPSYDLRIVRLLHGDTNPEGPGHKERAVETSAEGSFPGRVQVAHAGSFAIVEEHPLASGGAFTVTAIVQPTTPALGREQGIVSAASGVSLRLGGDGVPALHAGGTVLGVSGLALRPRTWYFVAAGVDADGTARCAVRPLDALGVDAPATAEGRLDGPVEIGADVPLLFGAVSPRSGLFNGKLEAPAVYGRLLTLAEIDAAAAGSAPGEPLASWDFSRGMSTDRVEDVAGGHHGRLVNVPARAVTGHAWDGSEVNPAHAPQQYAAIHFHDDDLDDAGWEPDAAWAVPEGFPSGTYAARLDAGGRTDHIPFVVRPPRGAATAEVGVLMPTLTYLAYANERLISSGVADGLMPDGVSETHWVDDYLARHPEWGRSLYDTHNDGSGVRYSSRLRPIPNMRPDYRFWSTGAPERYAADLYLVDWLDHEGCTCDFFTDEDLHHDGVELLERYKVIVTGTHPEYWTGAMLDALERYLAAGGRLMYLGGNGFYWVTTISPDKPHIVEVRRGFNGTRAWESAPGEGYHSTTGEPGGLWRYRGRAPNRLVGVGFTSQSDSHHPAPGYRRLAASAHPEAAFAFEGVDDDVIGDFGLINGGAAGYEIDRYDPQMGAPQELWHLASSQGMHDDSYMITVEDLLFTIPEIAGPTQEKVRADIVYARLGEGGEVFSVGSCNWCGSLSHAGYRNNVARITANVLRHFLRD
jgi:N,N-dimethylformamidase